MFWKFIYLLYPPFLRIFEHLGFHNVRQNYILGKLNPKYSPKDFRDFLLSCGFTHAVLAWRDPGEIFSLRLIADERFQHHIRLFNDGEIRAHYEYSSEGNPIFHVLSVGCREDREYFVRCLGDYMIRA